LIEETSYPFRGKVRMRINPSSPLAFPLLLRIPAWGAGTSIKVNGQRQPAPATGTFARIERTWKAGDRVDVEFPLEPRVSQWFNDSVAVERGALVFSYGIGEDWLKLRDRGMTADWQVYPTTQWNYALALNPASPSHDITTVEADVSARPFSAKGAPVTLHVKGRKLPAWQAENGVANPVPQSSVTSDQPEETIALIPYAAAKLRITAFPRLKT
jgi:glycosyl hydrolase family 127 (putative beta-L-arabinofuranosidase)